MKKLQDASIWEPVEKRGIPVKEYIEKDEDEIISGNLPKEMIEYLIFLETQQLAMSILSKYFKISEIIDPYQLIFLVSLFIATKIKETKPLSIADLLAFSNHSFTKKDIYRTQNKILDLLNFNLSFNLPCRRISCKLILISSLIHESIFEILENAIEDIQKYAYYYHLSGLLKESNGETNQPPFFPSAIIYVGLVLVSQNTGKFIQISSISSLFDLNQDSVIEQGERILKLILGKQKTQKYNI